MPKKKKNCVSLVCVFVTRDKGNHIQDSNFFAHIYTHIISYPIYIIYTEFDLYSFIYLNYLNLQ